MSAEAVSLSPPSSGDLVRVLPLDRLFPFPDHPFRVRDDEAMAKTVKSIARHGVLVPILARPRPLGGYEIADSIYTYNWNSGFGSVLSNPAEPTLNRAGGVKVLVYILSTGKYRGSDASWTPHFNDRTYSVLGNRGSWLQIRNSYYGGDCVNGRTYSGDALWITTQVALWNIMSGSVTGTYMMKTGLGSEHPQLPAYFGVGSSGDEFMTLIQGGALALISEAIQWALDGGTYDEEMQYIHDSII